MILENSKIEKDILELIFNEGNSVLSDKEIADKMKLPQTSVFKVRQQHSIPSSNQRLTSKAYPLVKELLTEDSNFTNQEIHSALRVEQLNISLSTVRKIVKQVKSENVEYVDVFDDFIGSDYSLKNQIMYAKASVLYPPHGLHTLLVGKTGVGKSYLAKCMHQFAVANRVMKRDSFVAFNCADYAQNPQLLYSHLFGHVKGAFTGAQQDSPGLIEKANGGILFLDEIHRLPVEGQEMLFSIIDNGEYRRLGEISQTHAINLMIIGATTEKIESYLLGTFRRRIPMLIELPDLKQRSDQEYLFFIQAFLKDESNQINKDIEISRGAIFKLFQYKHLYNIGRLQSEIKRIMAKAYLDTILGKEEGIKITGDVLQECLEDDHTGEKYQPTMRLQAMLIKKNHVIIKNKSAVTDIYSYIDKQNEDLLINGVPQVERRAALEKIVREKMSEVFTERRFEWEQNTRYYTEVSTKTQKIIEFFLQRVKKEFSLPEEKVRAMKYTLGYLVDSLVKQITVGVGIEENYEKDVYHDKKIDELTNVLIKKIREDYTVAISYTEFSYIYYCLYASIIKDDYQKSGIVIAMHGEVASKMAAVSNFFLKNQNIRAVDMDLEMNPNDIYSVLKEAIEEADQGKGVLFLTDMGSLTAFGTAIAKETGIQVETIERTDTLMVLEASNLTATSGFSISEVKARLVENKENKIAEVNHNKIKIYLYCQDSINYQFNYVLNFLSDNFIGFKEKYQIQLISSNSEINGKTESIIFTDRDFNDEQNNILSISALEEHTTLKKIRTTLRLPLKTNMQRVLSEELLFLNVKIKKKEQIIKFLFHELLETGCVTNKFYDNLIEREKLVNTYVGTSLAFPHTIDLSNIEKSQIAIATFEDHIDWDGFKVDIVCMLAIKENADTYFEQVYKLLSSKKELIKSLKNPESFKNILITKM